MKEFLYYKNIDEEAEVNYEVPETFSEIVELFYHIDKDSISAMELLKLSGGIEENRYSNEKVMETLDTYVEVVDNHAIIRPPKEKTRMKVKIIEKAVIESESNNKGNRNKLLQEECKISTIEYMFGKIFASRELQLDILFEVYFGLLYKQKISEPYVPLVREECRNKLITLVRQKDEAINLWKYFEEKRRYYKNKYVETDWKIETRNAYKDLLDVAPNVARFWIADADFRNMLSEVYEYERKDYKILPDVIKKRTAKLHLELRLDDKWVLEHLLGFGTGEMLYNLFKNIFKNFLQKDIEEYYDEIKTIVECIMEWPGAYSRTILSYQLWEYYVRLSNVQSIRNIHILLNDFVCELRVFSERYGTIYGELIKCVLHNERKISKDDVNIKVVKIYDEKILVELENKIGDLIKEISKEKSDWKNCFDKNVGHLQGEKLYKFIQGHVIQHGRCKQ